MSITNSQIQTIISSLETAKGMYHQLVLIVGPSGSGKTGALKQIAKRENTFVINVNLEISSQLLELTGKQRKTKLQAIFNDVVAQAQSPVILDNLEILFDTELEQDPLRLLQHASRNNLILASWNGVVQDGKLTYAEITHPEYRMYEISNIVIIAIDNA